MPIQRVFYFPPKWYYHLKPSNHFRSRLKKVFGKQQKPHNQS